VNLWCGVTQKFPIGITVLYVFRMLCVGFLEELIFRGFLYKALCRDGERKAAVISALTFGIGHIVNLLNGAELVPTVLQIVYAVAIGFVFVALFVRSGSIVPCILTHGVLNALGAFALEPDYRTQCIISVILIVVSVFLCSVSPAASAAVDKRGKLCQNGENTEGD